jgi:DNA-binding NarL/FixJ family response regulator
LFRQKDPPLSAGDGPALRSPWVLSRASDQGHRLPSTPVTIVVIDDNAAVREALRHRLTMIPEVEIGGEFSEAATALQALRALPPDIVILDVALESSNGLGLLKTIRAEQPSTKVLVFSNHAEPAYRRKFLSSGAYAFFDKSFDLDLLCNTIRTFLQAGFEDAQLRR